MDEAPMHTCTPLGFYKESWHRTPLRQHGQTGEGWGDMVRKWSPSPWSLTEISSQLRVKNSSTNDLKKNCFEEYLHGDSIPSL